MFRLGLTGGIGSGKSTVAELLALHGAVVIDADAISRELTAPHGRAIAPIAAEFGSDFIGADGAMDRARMRQASFSDPAARARLEAIVHPLVAHESSRRERRAIDQGTHCIVFDIPLLVESQHWRRRVDRVLVIDCEIDVQIARVMARNGLERAQVEAIIASQASRAQRLRAADVVIFNSGSDRGQIAREVAQIASRFGL